MCGLIIRTAILADVLAACLLALLLDKATDVANKEQLAVCMQYMYVSPTTQTTEEQFLASK